MLVYKMESPQHIEGCPSSAVTDISTFPKTIHPPLRDYPPLTPNPANLHLSPGDQPINYSQLPFVVSPEPYFQSNKPTGEASLGRGSPSSGLKPECLENHLECLHL